MHRKPTNQVKSSGGQQGPGTGAAVDRGARGRAVNAVDKEEPMEPVSQAQPPIDEDAKDGPGHSTTTEDIGSPSHENAPQREIKLKGALAYIRSVKSCFSRDREVYKRFLDTLSAFHKHKDCEKTYKQICRLFMGHEQLLRGFCSFLPADFPHAYRNAATPGSVQEGAKVMKLVTRGSRSKSRGKSRRKGKSRKPESASLGTTGRISKPYSTRRAIAKEVAMDPVAGSGGVNAAARRAIETDGQQDLSEDMEMLDGL